MRIAGVVAGVVVWLGSAILAPGALAGTPVISGTYILSGSSNCQAVVSLTRNAEGQVVGVQFSNQGALNAVVGTATFTPTTGNLTTGRVRVLGTSFDGPLAVPSGPNERRSIIKSLPVNEDWAYSNTETTVTLRGIVYQVAYGRQSAGVVQQLTLAGREEGNRCAFGATLIRR